MSELNSLNYFTPEMNMKYVSVSQYKQFMGNPFSNDVCEAAALAEAKGEIVRPITKSLLMGQYVDEALTGDLEAFKLEHPELFVTKGSRVGELKADYIQAEKMVERATSDPTFMDFMRGGEYQVIMTGSIENVPVKIKIDHVAYLKGKPVALVDLKTVRSMHETFRAKDSGEYMTWVERWNYDLQGAVYQEIYYQNTGLKLPFYIAAISKDKSDDTPHPRLKIIQIPQMKLDERLAEVKSNIWKIDALKKGEIQPIHCKHCDYCADNLPCEVISLDELLLEV